MKSKEGQKGKILDMQAYRMRKKIEEFGMELIISEDERVKLLLRVQASHKKNITQEK